METLQKRKERIIAAIEKDESLISKMEQLLNKKYEAQKDDETWKKYVEPIGEKTDIQDIIKNGGGNDKIFFQKVMENDFLGDIPEEEIFREIEKMS